ncbi:gamma-glutamylcyclotransferase family protein [Desulfocurvibacter africanus]|jgi:gamma-glutamylcyclotransferase (GGCT)/AIG2-like uncharacterized protein YtfP|uniref:Gamma-glutamylcyclotransferase family protein n=1 Tax=Desulfocurvibacter africanus PCS TaxID=1262666 RepID=M5PPJ8_DESAF|nr:gamma-glutamylcyclotransferase family protein [Desulfocurvibacter africanus]EMG36207.1 hypothetical protein PCS_03051 [Desulfocurvibacter africanus PCS]
MARDFEYVFVYGTLRRSFQNHRLLSRSPCLGGAGTRERYALYVGEYPFVVRDQPVSPIIGEVYKVDPATLMVLDALEEHPQVYRREKVPVVLDDGREIEAWLYFYPRPGGRLIESGDYAGNA